jgi:circadian clock protein KaiB
MKAHAAPALVSRFSFRLFIAGTAPNSTRALEALHAVCRRHLGDEYDVTVIDVLREPARALADGILVTPTLIKLAPGPTRTIIGDLSKADLVTLLGLADPPGPT